MLVLVALTLESANLACVFLFLSTPLGRLPGSSATIERLRSANIRGWLFPGFRWASPGAIFGAPSRKHGAAMLLYSSASVCIATFIVHPAGLIICKPARRGEKQGIVISVWGLKGIMGMRLLFSWEEGRVNLPNCDAFLCPFPQSLFLRFLNYSQDPGGTEIAVRRAWVS